MNRSPRRPPRIQLPLWGRLSAPPLGKNQIMAAVRQRSPVSSRHTGVIKVVEPCDRIDPDWLALYRSFPGLFSRLDRLWKWLVVLAGLISLSFMLGNL